MLFLLVLILQLKMNSSNSIDEKFALRQIFDIQHSLFDHKIM